MSGQRQHRAFLRCAEADAEHPDLRGDVLQRGLAEVVDLQRHLAGGVLAHAGRNANATGFGQRFQPGRDDHAVADEIVAFRHHLALVHPNAQAEAVGLGTQRILDGDGTAQRLHRAGEIDEEAVAGSLEQAATMRCRERFDHVGAQGTHPRQRPRLICSDHDRIADHIGRQDAGQTTVRLAHAQNSVADEHRAMGFGGQSMLATFRRKNPVMT